VLKKRMKRQQMLYSNFSKDIDDYFSNPTYYCVPMYLLTELSRFAGAEYNNDLLENFYLSRRKFQKLGKFDPSQYIQNTGDFTFYFVKHTNSIFLVAYDYEKVIVFAMCVHS